MRALRRRWFDDDVFEMPEPALVRKTLARRPRARHDLDRLVKARLCLVERDLEASKLAVTITLADTEIEAAARQKIKRCGLFSQQHRIVPGRHDDRRTQTQGGRAGRERCQQHQCRRDLIPSAEMMLDRETGMKAQSLGLDVEVEVIEKALPGIGSIPGSIGLRRTEQTKAHS